jgi:hypothetical protein
VSQHLNSKTAFGSRRCYSNRGRLRWRSPRLERGQVDFLPAALRSRPSAFAIPGVAFPRAGIPARFCQWPLKSCQIQAANLGHVVTVVGSARSLVKKSALAFSGQSLGRARSWRLLGLSGQILVSAGCASRTVGQCNQEAQCSLTHRSMGGPTACHQAWATECSCPFSVAQAWRPTVGLPISYTLGSTLKQRGAPAFQIKCGVWQQLVQCRTWRLLWHSGRS